MRAHPSAAAVLLENLSGSLATLLHKTSDALIKRDQWKLKLTGPDPESAPRQDDDGWMRRTLGGLFQKRPSKSDGR